MSAPEGAQQVSDSYHLEVDGLVDGFRYELCTECGRDIDAHVIAPDTLGKPHAWCLFGAEAEEQAAKIRAKIVEILDTELLATLSEALAAIDVAAAGYSNDTEIQALQRALDCALTRWPEIPER